MHGTPEPTLNPVPIMELRPTQITVGMREVEEKRRAWREKGDKAAARVALKAAEPEIMRGVSKGILHKNTGSRKVSRLTKRVAKLSK